MMDREKDNKDVTNLFNDVRQLLNLHSFIIKQRLPFGH